MGTPDNKSDTELTVSKVEALVSQALVEQDGKKVLDYSKVDGIDENPALKVAMEAELRRRQTQAEYTRSRQEIAKLKAQAEVLQTKLPTAIDVPLSQELLDRQEALEELKYEDVDAWYEEKKKLEADIAAFKKENVNKVYEEATNVATKAELLAQREQALAMFNAKNPDKPLSIDLLDTYTPPVIMQKLNAGEISFDEALKVAHSVLYGTGATANPQDPGMKSLGEVGASSGEQHIPSIEDTSIY